MDKKHAKQLRVAVFGGTFDPPHKGHSTLINQVLGLNIIDEVWLIPVFIPPLKREEAVTVASASDRFKMCLLLADTIKLKSRVKVLDIEIKRQGKSYTYNTVQELKKKYPNYKFYFLIGSDWLKDLDKWYKIDELLNEIEFIVLPRTGVSSTVIRRMVKRGLSITNFVPKGIADYIESHNLYR